MSVRLVLVLAGFLISSPILAVNVANLEGEAHGFPAVFDMNGRKIAEGDFLQSFDGERLRIRISYRFRGGDRVEERAILKQGSELIQEHWSWRQVKSGELEREFVVDFTSQRATAKKREEGKLRTWSEKIKIQPGRTFAGFGFTLALQNLRKQLLKGETIELEAIAFNPKPRVVTVELRHGGLDEMKMADRWITGDRFIINPMIPAIAKIFVHVPETRIWLTKPPAGFLRWEGPLAEPSDPLVRVDLIPGGQSGAARPLQTARSEPVETVRAGNSSPGSIAESADVSW